MPLRQSNRQITYSGSLACRGPARPAHCLLMRSIHNGGERSNQAIGFIMILFGSAESGHSYKVRLFLLLSRASPFRGARNKASGNLDRLPVAGEGFRAEGEEAFVAVA